MRSFQERLMDEFELIAARNDCEAVQHPHWANTGKVLATRCGQPFNVVARLHYDIQSGISKVWFNDADHLEPWFDPYDADKRRRNPDVYYFEAHDEAMVRAAFARWEALLAPPVTTRKEEAAGMVAARAQRKAGIR